MAELERLGIRYLSRQSDYQAKRVRAPQKLAGELNLPPATPAEQLRALACLHRQKTGIVLNWAGTYDHAARHLLRRWELDKYAPRRDLRGSSPRSDDLLVPQSALAQWVVPGS